MRRTLAILALPFALALSGCSGSEADACAPESQKAATRDLLRSWYLYPDLLAPVDPGDPAYPTVDDYLWALTAPAREAQPSLDRGWTYATTLAAAQQFYEEGTSVGFGLGLLQRGTQEYVSQVFPLSAAAEAGFVRGDELLAIGETPDALVDVATLIASGTLGSAFGPSEAGITRTFRVLPLGATEPVLRTATKRVYGIDPVPAWTVIDRPGLPPAGYVALRTFITPAEPLLEQAFAGFLASGVRDVVVDLRYNGGGLVATADLLANLLAGARAAGDVMFRVENNAFHQGENATFAFAPPPQAIAPFRIAFVTTGASASASELVPNVLEAWIAAGALEVALVGAKTYGKPVGQRGFLLEECGTVVYAVSFRLVNAQGDGGYFDGLPDADGSFSGPLCAAEDDLAHAPGDPAEASTAAALAFLETGACPVQPAPLSAPAALPRAAAAPDRYPEAPAPDLAQRHVRGVF